METNIPFNPVLSTDIAVKILDPGHHRGLTSETKAFKAATVLVKDYVVTGIPSIVRVIWARMHPHLRLESKGIDLLFELADGCCIPAQIKSSKRRTKHFTKRHKWRQARGWFTAVTEAIVIGENESRAEIIVKFADYLRRAYVAMRKRVDRIMYHKKLQWIKFRTNGKNAPAPQRKHFRFMRQPSFANAHC